MLFVNVRTVVHLSISKLAVLHVRQGLMVSPVTDLDFTVPETTG